MCYKGQLPLLLPTRHWKKNRRTHINRLNHFAKSLCGTILTKKAPRELRVKVEAKRAAKARKRETRESSPALIPDVVDLIELISATKDRISDVDERREEGRTVVARPQQD
jgi:hypothetical protein